MEWLKGLPLNAQASRFADKDFDFVDVRIFFSCVKAMYVLASFSFHHRGDYDSMQGHILFQASFYVHPLLQDSKNGG